MQGIMFSKIGTALVAVPILSSWHVAAIGSDSNSTAPTVDAGNNTLFTIENEGRCTDVLTGSPVDESKAIKEVVCNTYTAQVKCVSNSLCIWRNDR